MGHLRRGLVICAIVVTGGGCGGDDESSTAASSVPASTAPQTEARTGTSEAASTINVIADALESAGYDTAPSAGSFPEGATARIELRKGGLKTDLANSYVTVFSTPQQADQAARKLAEPGIEVRARKNVLFEVDDDSGDDPNAIIVAAGY